MVIKIFLGIGFALLLTYNAILAGRLNVEQMKTEGRHGEFQIDRDAIP